MFLCDYIPRSEKEIKCPAYLLQWFSFFSLKFTTCTPYSMAALVFIPPARFSKQNLTKKSPCKPSLCINTYVLKNYFKSPGKMSLIFGAGGFRNTLIANSAIRARQSREERKKRNGRSKTTTTERDKARSLVPLNCCVDSGDLSRVM